MNKLKNGTLIQCEEFVGLFIGNNSVLILDCNEEHFFSNDLIGKIFPIKPCANHNWILEMDYSSFLVKEDWNNVIKIQEFSYGYHYDYDDYWWDDDWDLDYEMEDLESELCGY